MKAILFGLVFVILAQVAQAGIVCETEYVHQRFAGALCANLPYPTSYNRRDLRSPVLNDLYTAVLAVCPSYCGMDEGRESCTRNTIQCRIARCFDTQTGYDLSFYRLIPSNCQFNAIVSHGN